MPRGGTGTKKRVPNIYVYIYTFRVWVSEYHIVSSSFKSPTVSVEQLNQPKSTCRNCNFLHSHRAVGSPTLKLGESFGLMAKQPLLYPPKMKMMFFYKRNLLFQGSIFQVPAIGFQECTPHALWSRLRDIFVRKLPAGVGEGPSKIQANRQAL